MTAGRRSADVAFVVVLALVALIALVVFAPWRPPGFVSDTWYHLAHYGSMTPSDLGGLFLPRAADWYRPLTGVGYWLEWHLFGLQTSGYFFVELTAHGLASVLVGALTLNLTRSRWAGLVAGAAFLFTLQAHEAAWDYADLHRVVSAAVLPATVLAYVRGRRGLALLGAVAALLVDEAGVLVLPLLVSYELLFRIQRVEWRSNARAAAQRLAPIAALTLLYAAARLAAGGIYNEVGQPCRSLPCLVVGGAEYLNRLVVRGDDLLALLGSERPVIALVVAGLGVMLLAAIAPWRWPDWRPLAFGFVWAALGSALFVLTLWPYVADRFVYVPAMGAALAIGAAIAGGLAIWPRSGAPRRAAMAAACLVLVGWVGLGALTLAERGRRWIEAGETARVLAADLYALLPAPSSGTQVLVYDVPRMLRPTFRPGNTGPYVYNNGFEWAMRLVYGWRGDVALPRDPTTYQPPPGSVVLEFEVIDGRVVPRGGD